MPPPEAAALSARVTIGGGEGSAGFVADAAAGAVAVLLLIVESPIATAPELSMPPPLPAVAELNAIVVSVMSGWPARTMAPPE